MAWASFLVNYRPLAIRIQLTALWMLPRGHTGRCRCCPKRPRVSVSTMKAAAYLFGDSRPSDGAAGGWSCATWTVIGSAAIPLWATWPTLAAWASAMPVFQLLAIAFTIGTVTLYGMERRSAATES